MSMVPLRKKQLWAHDDEPITQTVACCRVVQSHVQTLLLAFTVKLVAFRISTSVMLCLFNLDFFEFHLSSMTVTKTNCQWLSLIVPSHVFYQEGSSMSWQWAWAFFTLVQISFHSFNKLYSRAVSHLFDFHQEIQNWGWGKCKTTKGGIVSRVKHASILLYQLIPQQSPWSYSYHVRGNSNKAFLPFAGRGNRRSLSLQNIILAVFQSPPCLSWIHAALNSC